MQITPGVHVGPYEILASIGAGGMGEVWRARDPRIGRDVAIKFVPADLRSPERLHRFEQEARTAGSLNHPNLVTVFDLGTEDAVPYVVMEMLEGETLRQKLGETGARIPIRKAVDYAVQIANGLAAAHEHGIVHRDLKPENIIVTNDGRVKIVDFGLAKPSARAESTDVVTQQRDTTPGTVLGTAGYMSPEQVRGQQVDHRSDLFSFGSILYEMLSGRRAFHGNSSVETMNAILKEDPPELASSEAHIPPGLEAVVHHCLEKNASERFQSARDLAFDLQRASSLSQSGVSLTVAKRSKRWFVPAAVLALLAAAATAGWFIGRRGIVTTAAPQERRTFAQLTFHSHEAQPSLSPDGKMFAFASDIGGHSDIYVQRVDGQNAIDLTKDSGADNYQPAFSPDGSQIAFRSDRSGGGIFVMGATGESVRRISDFGFNPAWSPDGAQIAVCTDSITGNPRGRGTRSTLWLLDVRTGARKQISKRDAVQPAWSPHGDRIAFWGVVGNGGQRDLFTLNPRAGDPEKSVTRITSDSELDWSPAWSPDGKWLYFGSDRDGSMNLWRIAIDETRGEPAGAMEPVTTPARFAGFFSLSRGGDVVFETVDQTDTLWSIPIDAPARARPILSGALAIYSTDISPDGQWIAFSNSGTQEDIYLMRADGSDLRQLTNDAERDRAPAFSLDGNLLYFYAERTGRYEMWSIKPDGSDLRQVSHLSGQSFWYPRPMHDGKALYAFNGEQTVILPFDADGSITRVDPLPKSEDGIVLRLPRLSPDGTTFLGTVARPLSKAGIWTYTLATKKYERLTAGGEVAGWSQSSPTTVFYEQNGKLFTVDTRTKQIHPFDVPAVRNAYRLQTSPDGHTLLVNEITTNKAIWLMKTTAPRASSPRTPGNQSFFPMQQIQSVAGSAMIRISE